MIVGVEAQDVRPERPAHAAVAGNDRVARDAREPVDGAGEEVGVALAAGGAPAERVLLARGEASGSSAGRSAWRSPSQWP